MSFPALSAGKLNRAGLAGATCSGRGSPASSAAMASAVSGASRMPLRKWPVARMRPSIAPGPISGRLSGVPGRRPAIELDQLHLGDVGEQAVGLAQQLEDAAGADRRVEAALFDRGADDQAAVGRGGRGRRARRRRSARPAAAAPSRPRSSSTSPLTGRTGGRACSGSHSVAPDQAPVARTTCSARSSSPAGGADPGQALALEEAVDHLASGPQLASGARRAPPAGPAPARAGRSPPRRRAWTPPLKDGVRPGSSSRQRRGASHSASRSSERCRSWTRRSWAASSRSSATCRAPGARVAGRLARSPPRARRRNPGSGARRRGSAPAAPARRRSARRPAPASRRRRGSRPAGGSARSSTTTRAPAARRARRSRGRSPHRLRIPRRNCASRSSHCLRRHYPDQVQTVGGLDATLSALADSRYSSDATPYRRRLQADPGS